MDECPGNCVLTVLCARSVISTVEGMLFVDVCTPIADTAKLLKLGIRYSYRSPPRSARSSIAYVMSASFIILYIMKSNIEQKDHRPHVVAGLERTCMQATLYLKP